MRSLSLHICSQELAENTGSDCEIHTVLSHELGPRKALPHPQDKAQPGETCPQGVTLVIARNPGDAGFEAGDLQGCLQLSRL